jgi:predicted permease
VINLLAQLWRRITHYRRREQYDRDLEEEMGFHLEMRVEENLAAGMLPEQARSAARRQFGNPTLLREVSREMWGFRSLETLIQDLRFGLRMLTKNPGFTVIAVVTLALGIGANSAIFSVVNAILLRPLPYKNSEQIVKLWGDLHQPGLEEIEASALEYQDYKEQNKVFEEIAAYNLQGVNLTGGNEPERIRGANVTSNLLTLLGIQPAHGRAFLSEEEKPGGEQVVILSNALWQRRFGADANLVGKTIMLDGKPATVVGIMPFGFRFPDNETELWRPIVFSAEDLVADNRGSRYLDVIARLKPGIKLEQAQFEMRAIAQRLTQEHRHDYPKGFGANVKSLHDEVVGNVRPALLIFLGAVGFVLLIACANVANLLLARGSARHREVAIRTALGATRLRLIRQLLTESILLSLVGGILGLLLALWGVDVLASLSPADTPRVSEIRLDRSVVGFTLFISLLTGVLFGLAPALQTTKPDLNEALKEGGRSATEGGRRKLIRSLLVISEFALALVLLIGAALLIKSFTRLQEVSPGFNSENLLTMRISLSQSKYKEFRQGLAFYQQLMAQLKSRPGIESVGAINILPFSGSRGDRSFVIEGRPVAPGEVYPDEELRFTSPGYFSTMTIPLLKGRDFNERDLPETLRVALINQALARKYWPGQDPIGKRIGFGALRDKPIWYEIVGITGDVKHSGLELTEKPELYLPAFQPLFEGSTMPSMFVVVRTPSDLASTVAIVRREVLAIDQDQPIANIKTMEARIAESVSQRRFNMILLGIFAFVALALAAVGIYGIMAYLVTQRTHEIGVRMALGAQRRDVLWLIVRQGMTLALLGSGIGVFAAIGLTRLMKGLLFGVSTTDPLTYIMVPLFLTLVALLACLLPARKATRIDPLIALRYE